MVPAAVGGGVVNQENRPDDDVSRRLTLVGIGLAVLLTILGSLAWFMNRLAEAVSS